MNEVKHAMIEFLWVEGSPNTQRLVSEQFTEWVDEHTGQIAILDYKILNSHNKAGYAVEKMFVLYRTVPQQPDVKPNTNINDNENNCDVERPEPEPQTEALEEVESNEEPVSPEGPAAKRSKKG